MTTTTNVPTISLGKYIAARIEQLETEYMFGLPGDFNLALLDEMLTNDKIKWVGNANELNASYAADAYARANKKLGVLFTTYGVGELSAVNGIAGSYAEYGAVLHIVGTPSFEKMKDGKHLHHTMTDGDYNHFAKIFDEITVDSLLIQPDDILDLQKLTDRIDEILQNILTYSRPGYLGVPQHLVLTEVPAGNLATSIEPKTADQTAVAAFKQALDEKITAYLANHDQKFIGLAGMLNYRRDTKADLLALADTGKFNLAFQPNSRTLIPEEHAANLGLYLGGITPNTAIRDYVDGAELLFLIGTVLGEWNMGNFTNGFDEKNAVELGINFARIDTTYYENVPLDDSLPILVELIQKLDNQLVDTFDHTNLPAEKPTTGDLNIASFWGNMQNFFAASTGHDVIISEMGTTIFGIIDVKLPEHSDFVSQHLWGAIGYTLPAVLGVGLAEAEQTRPILIIGDGSTQLTVQELGTIDRWGIKPLIIMINNAGYTIERAIQKPNAIYHEITAWDHNSIVQGLMPTAQIADVYTVDDLNAALAAAEADKQTTHFLNVRVDPQDLPPVMRAFFK
ncbi:MAG: hypothetical protein LBT80_00900 [Lactobacillaceae bacterium]|jgi:indolepyruvate decarboxylase|nr:hypothetical protein [Lactobacillaceae bacterium]